jgi:hypothetical protein
MRVVASSYDSAGVCTYMAVDIHRQQFVAMLHQLEMIPEGMALENVRFRGDIINIELGPQASGGAEHG